MNWTRRATGATLFVGALLLALLAGCGGHGGGSGPGDNTMSFGPITTRVAGTVQPPVTSSSVSGGYAPGAAVTGVAGGDITSLTLSSSNIGWTAPQIAFTTTRDGFYKTYVMNSDGTAQARISSAAGDEIYPSWSHDGSRIAFHSTRDGNYEIYTMKTDGTGVVRLTNNPEIDAFAVWSPDDTKFAFTSTRDGNYEIYVMNADGTNQTRVTNDPSFDAFPTWSPDGKKIAYTSNRDGNYEIYVIGVDGSSPTRITNNSAVDHSPSWSPDGTRIAFATNRDGNYQIYTMAPDGTAVTRVMNLSGINDYPKWSPDSARIAFSNTEGTHVEILTIEGDGRNRTRLTDNTYEDRFPTWAPFNVPNKMRTVLIGPDGSMGTNAAGFLFSQSHQYVCGLVAFDAQTRTSARVIAQTAQETNGPNIIFSISADLITRLSYFVLQDALPKVVAIVGSGGAVPSATDALISFDANNGMITSVMPYTSARSPAPVIRLENGQRVIRGRFQAVFDGKGQNRAPNGAVEVRLDAKTGAVVGVR